LFFFWSCGPLLLLDGFQVLDGRQYVAGFAFLATGDG
jgi:hypothetical protein